MTRRWIDVHQHAVPDFYRQALAEADLVQPIPGVSLPRWTAGDALEAMEANDLQAAVLSISAPGVSFAPPDEALGLAARLNEFLVEVTTQYPGRFAALATLPLPDMPAALTELTFALDVLRLDGVMLFSNYQGRYLGAPEFADLFAELDRRAAVALIHPAAPTQPCQATPDLPLSLYEFPFDTVRTVISLLYSGTLERHQRMRLILPHGGGPLPFLAQRLVNAPAISPVLAARQPADPVGDLRRLHYDLALTAGEFALPSLMALADPSRVLFGSDYPFMTADRVSANRAGLLAHGGCTDSIDMIGRRNALTLFPRLARPSTGSSLLSVPPPRWIPEAG